MTVRVSYLALAAALVAGACATTETDALVATVQDAHVTRQDDGALSVTWTTAEDSAPVNVYVAGSPDAAMADMTLVSEADVDGGHVFRQSANITRPYVFVANAAGEGVWSAERVLPLDGGRNFRDLGGYVTEDGQRVRWGRIYRSGVMHEITDGDYEYLANLNIGVVCDFRSSEERAGEPTDWRAGEIEYLAWDYESDTSEFAALFAGDVTADTTRAMMTGFYHEIAYEHAERYAVMFDRLAAAEGPVAFNCSAGKDRTGVAAALILTALGVPRDAIIADYALSDDVVDYMAEYQEDAAAAEAEGADNPYAFLAQLDPAVLAPLMASDPAYLEAAFAHLEAEHGSVMAFIQEELDVTDEELAAMRSAYLERS